MLKDHQVLPLFLYLMFISFMQIKHVIKVLNSDELDIRNST